MFHKWMDEMKIVKWEYFFLFDDGEREIMWDITKKANKKLLSHEVEMLNNHQFAKMTQSYYPFIMIATYLDGTQKEI